MTMKKPSKTFKKSITTLNLVEKMERDGRWNLKQILIGYYTAHLRRYDSEGNMIIIEEHPPAILKDTEQFVYDEIFKFIEDNDPTRIDGYWHNCICAKIMYENLRTQEEIEGGYSDSLYRDDNDEQIHTHIDFSNQEEYNKMIKYIMKKWTEREEKLSRETNERNSKDYIIKYLSELEFIFWSEIQAHDLNQELKIEKKVGEIRNEIMIPRNARGAGSIPHPRFFIQKGIIDPPSRGLRECFKKAVFILMVGLREV